MEGSI